MVEASEMKKQVGRYELIKDQYAAHLKSNEFGSRDISDYRLPYNMMFQYGRKRYSAVIRGENQEKW